MLGQRSCVRPVDAARIAAGPNALRGSGPNPFHAFKDAMTQASILIPGTTVSALRRCALTASLSTETTRPRRRRRRLPSMWPPHPEDVGRTVEDFNWEIRFSIPSSRQASPRGSSFPLCGRFLHRARNSSARENHLRPFRPRGGPDRRRHRSSAIEAIAQWEPVWTPEVPIPARMPQTKRTATHRPATRG
jgi:hypothetical protein